MIHGMMYNNPSQRLNQYALFFFITILQKRQSIPYPAVNSSPTGWGMPQEVISY